MKTVVVRVLVLVASCGVGGLAAGCSGESLDVVPVLCPRGAGDPRELSVSDACGVFVQADAAGARQEGTQAHPYTTLQQGIDHAGGKRIYVCSSAPYDEAVTIEAPVAIYGGFACHDGWAWTATGRSVLTAPPGSIPLTFTARADGARVQGFSITAAPARVNGGSSIAVIVDDIAAELAHCEVTAGDAIGGEAGVTPWGAATRGADAPQAALFPMSACLLDTAYLVGGPAGVTICDDGITAGGRGGSGGRLGEEGQSGADGLPADALTGQGGAGEDAVEACVAGSDGKNGHDGAAGDSGRLPGALGLTGIRDTNRTDGKPGTRGGGGGGGGGAKSGLFCSPAGTPGNGASGGGGGAGSCGSKGGGGGKAGGSSLAIVSLGTRLTLTDVALRTGRGGHGGNGAPGQSPGQPGSGASGGDPSAFSSSSSSSISRRGCASGSGGRGGLGGSGGGGRGGHSVGVAYATAPRAAPALARFEGERAGEGGAAGPLNPTGEGARGAAGACWDFENNTSCTP